MQQENPNDNSVERDIAALSDMALQLYQEGHLQQAPRLRPDHIDARFDLALGLQLWAEPRPLPGPV